MSEGVGPVLWNTGHVPRQVDVLASNDLGRDGRRELRWKQ